MNRYLSLTYNGWYRKLFKTTKIDAEQEILHPHYKFFKNNVSFRGSELKCSLNRALSSLESAENELRTNSEELYEYIRSMGIGNIDAFIKSLPPVTSTRLYFGNENNKPKLIVVNKATAFVLVYIGKDTLYLDNYFTTDKLLKDDVRVIENIGILKHRGYYFISEFKGYDYETLILDFGNRDLKDVLLNRMLYVEKCTKDAVLFRNNAPRNIIKSDDSKLGDYIIDFDHVYPINSTSNESLFLTYLDKKTWYADIFDSKTILSSLNGYEVTNKENTRVGRGSFLSYFCNDSDNLIYLSDVERVYDLIEQTLIF